MEGHSDKIGNQSVEVGIALDRALEVSRHIQWLAEFVFEFEPGKVRFEIIPLGSNRLLGNNAALNRRVELKGFCES
jgi:hypothetical protein